MSSLFSFTSNGFYFFAPYCVHPLNETFINSLLFLLCFGISDSLFKNFDFIIGLGFVYYFFGSSGDR
jgi:hypothetical protein